MGVQVDEMISEVTAEPEPQVGGTSQRVRWEEEARVREAMGRISRDRFRTAAEGYDD